MAYATSTWLTIAALTASAGNTAYSRSTQRRAAGKQKDAAKDAAEKQSRDRASARAHDYQARALAGTRRKAGGGPSGLIGG